MLPREGFPSGATVGYAKAQVRDILKAEFNKSVELQVRSSVHFSRGERLFKKHPTWCERKEVSTVL